MHSSKLRVITARDAGGAPITREKPSKKQILASVLRILRENTLCSMATVTASHRAHISTAYFCYSRDLELYFWSHPNSLHCRNLAANPSLSVAVFSSSQKWAGPDKGLQLFGTCRMASGAQAKKADKLYAKRFSNYAAWRRSRKSGDPALAYRFYRFVPSSVKVLDEREFGDALFVSATVN